MDPVVVMQEAHDLAISDKSREIQERGILMPSRCVDPLHHTGGYTLQEYEMMERDRGKYLLYWAAIKMAVNDYVQKQSQSKPKNKKKRPAPLKMTFCVLGAGLGRLVSFCLDAAADHDVDVTVLAVDANARAIEFLTRLFAGRSEVKILSCTVVPNSPSLPDKLIPYTNSCALLVSELLGSFADNEFCGEVLAVAKKLLQPNGICIPQSWTTYLSPVWTNDQNSVISEEGLPTEGFFLISSPANNSTTTTNSPPPPPSPAYSSQALQPIPNTISSVVRISNPDPDSFVVGEGGSSRGEGEGLPCARVFGMAGYFCAVLFGEIVVDTRDALRSFNSFHWEAMYFPLKEPITFEPGMSFHLTRRCEPILRKRGRNQQPLGVKLWYEWCVQNEAKKQIGDFQNRDGASHHVCLYK